MTTNPFGVRKATQDDFVPLCLLARDLLSETSVLPVSASKVEALVARCISQKDGAIAGVIDGEDWRIDASIGLVFVESPISDEPYIEALWCGLHPEARRLPVDHKSPKAHYGRRLFDFAKWFQGTMEGLAERPILTRFDLTALEDLKPKLGLYQRNLMQIGGTFAVRPEKALASKAA